MINEFFTLSSSRTMRAVCNVCLIGGGGKGVKELTTSVFSKVS